MKKNIATLLISCIILPLMSCSEGEENYSLSNPGELKDGYVSLTNENENPSIVDGKYVIKDTSYKVKEVLNATYEKEPSRVYANYLSSFMNNNYIHTVNLIDGLVDYDKYGNIVGALALGYKYIENEDGTVTYSFQLRENAEWVDHNGKKYSNVVAEDFLSSAKYILTSINQSQFASLLTEFIVGAKEYYEGTESDFSIVGIKAKEKYVIEYTINNGYSYFMKMLTYPAYYPLNNEYFEAQGEDFGKDYDHILINGPFTIIQHDAESQIVYKKNMHYYDRDHVYVKKVVRKYVPKTKTYDVQRKLFESGNIDEFVVDNNDQEGYQKYVGDSISSPVDDNCNSIVKRGEVTYYGYFNINRTTYNYGVVDASHVKTEGERKETTLALLNANFRKAFMHAIDFNLLLNNVDASNAVDHIKRGLVPSGSVSGNKDYTSYLDDYYNEKNNTNISLVGLNNGNDPIFNLEKAREYFSLAKEELISQGVEGPIYIDYISTSINVKRANAYRMMFQYINECSDGFVEVIQNIPTYDESKWYDNNFVQGDINLWQGITIDNDVSDVFNSFTDGNQGLMDIGLPISKYDSTSKLNPYLPEEYLNLIQDDDNTLANQKLREDLFGKYYDLLDDANQYINPKDGILRYKSLAKAEYELLFDSCLLLPWYSATSREAKVTNILPYQKWDNAVNTIYSFKNVIVINEIVSQEMYQDIYQNYQDILKN